jgi:Ca2+-binding EF-hand superfamily protein
MKTLKQIAAVSLLASFTALGAHASDGDKMLKRFEEIDGNKDGVITHAEMMAKVSEKFGELDKNGNGYLVLSELPKNMPVPEHVHERKEKRREKMKERMAKDGRKLAELFEDGKMKGPPTRMKFMAKFDKDGDEQVSLEEFALKAVKRFKRGDVNGDGSVTLAEMKEARLHHMKKRIKEHRRHRG